MAPRKFVLAVFTVLSVFNAAAQTSFSEMLGSQLTVEESLVSFTNTVTGLQLEAASEVFLYVVAPLFGFYYLTLNFVSMSYELFEDRVDRDSWESNDEDIPTGMKGFAAVTSVITVLFLGGLGAGLLLFAGLGSFVLAVLMMTGLFTEGLGGNGGNGNGGNGNNGNGNGGNGNNGNNNNGNGNGGAGLTDLLDAAGNFLGQANNLSQNLQQQGQQQNQNQTAGQIQEALKEFEGDMLDEMSQVRNKSTSINRKISDAETQLTNASEIAPNDFEKIYHRAENIDSYVATAKSKMESDLAATPRPNFAQSELGQFMASNPFQLQGQLESLEGQLERLLDVKQVAPPDDIFNDLIDALRPVVAVGHFAAESPYTFGELGNDRRKCQEVIQAAISMNKLQNPSGNEASELQNLAQDLNGMQNIVRDLISRSEILCREEMQLSRTEVHELKRILGDGEEIHRNLEFIRSNLGNYQGVQNFQSRLSDNIDMITHIDNKLASVESTVAQHGKFESETYKKLKELESKI